MLFQYSLSINGPPLLDSQQNCPGLGLELVLEGAGLCLYRPSQVHRPSGDLPRQIPWRGLGRILLAHTWGKEIITNIV